MIESNGLYHIASEMKEAYFDAELHIGHDGDNKSDNFFGFEEFE